MGSLKIIINSVLTKCFSAGPEHRENVTVDHQKAKEIITTWIKSCIQSLFNKHGFTTTREISCDIRVLWKN